MTHEANDDEDLKDEERQQAILIFKSLVWLTTILMLAAIALQIYGFQGKLSSSL